VDTLPRAAIHPRPLRVFGAGCLGSGAQSICNFTCRMPCEPQPVIIMAGAAWLVQLSWCSTAGAAHLNPQTIGLGTAWPPCWLPLATAAAAGYCLATVLATAGCHCQTVAAIGYHMAIKQPPPTEDWCSIAGATYEMHRADYMLALLWPTTSPV